MTSRTVGATALAVAVGCALVASAISFGLNLSPAATLARLPSATALDYTATFGPVLAPLRRAYVQEVLGLTPGEPDAPRPDAAPVHPAALVPGGRGAADPFAIARVEEAHTFTNDDMRDARSIPRIPFTAATETGEATREDSEPEDCSTAGGTAWYRYRSLRTEDIVANTFGSDHAVTLGVFERTADGSGIAVGCHGDVTGSALVQFQAAEGTEYLFQVASPTGGRLVFNLEPIGQATLVSASPSGDAGSPIYSQLPSVSADGRLVAFESYATNLHPDTPTEPCHTALRAAPTSLEEAQYPDHGAPCPHAYVRDLGSGEIRLVSVTSTGEPGDLGGQSPRISGNGRFVAFISHSTNLVDGDTNGASDIFVHDLLPRRTERVSVTSAGRQSTASPPIGQTVEAPSISDDGRVVAFTSRAADLVEDDGNGVLDVFVHDRATRRTERVSVSTGGEEGDGESRHAAISPDGRYVFFVSDATNLVASDSNGFADAFVHDRVTGSTEIVSVSSAGHQGNESVDSASRSAMSAGGRYVVFASRASNLVPGDENGTSDVFLRDRELGITERVSVSSWEGENRDLSHDPTISVDGRYVAFASGADDLAPGARPPATHLAPATVDNLYVRDRWTGTTTYIPVPAASEANGDTSTRAPALSADGGTVVFMVVCPRDFSCGAPGVFAQVWAIQRPRRP